MMLAGAAPSPGPKVWVLTRFNGTEQPPPRHTPRHGFANGAVVTFVDANYGGFRCENMIGDFAIAGDKIVLRHSITITEFGSQHSAMCEAFVGSSRIRRGGRRLVISSPNGARSVFEFTRGRGDVG